MKIKPDIASKIIDLCYEKTECLEEADDYCLMGMYKNEYILMKQVKEIDKELEVYKKFLKPDWGTLDWMTVRKRS